jgi:hypothetical protein
MANNTIDCTRMSHLACLQPEPEPEFESAGDDVYECLNECVGSQAVVAAVNTAIVYSACAALPLACPIFQAANLAAIVGSCAIACDNLTDPPLTEP